jgi:hypothetical protein
MYVGSISLQVWKNGAIQNQLRSRIVKPKLGWTGCACDAHLLYRPEALDDKTGFDDMLDLLLVGKRKPEHAKLNAQYLYIQKDCGMGNGSHAPTGGNCCCRGELRLPMHLSHTG